MATLAQYKVLGDELTNDPEARGYAGMTDDQLLTSGNAADFFNPNATLDSAQIFEALDAAELAGLSAAAQDRLKRVLDLGQSIKIGPGTRARAELVAIFGGGSTTVANLAALPGVKISRMTLIGWGFLKQKDLGRVRGEQAAGKI